MRGFLRKHEVGFCRGTTGSFLPVARVVHVVQVFVEVSWWVSKVVHAEVLCLLESGRI